MNTTP